MRWNGGAAADGAVRAEAYGPEAEIRGYGLVFFAAILLLMVGFFNMIYGIAAIANSHILVANAHYVFAA